MYASDRIDQDNVNSVQKVEIFDHIAYRSTAIITLEFETVDGTWDFRFAGDEYLVIHSQNSDSIYMEFKVSWVLKTSI